MNNVKANIDCNMGNIKYSIKFDSDVPVTWRNYINNRIRNNIELLNKEYQDYLVVKSKEPLHNIDWMC